jgi:hypothetical protein
LRGLPLRLSEGSTEPPGKTLPGGSFSFLPGNDAVRDGGSGAAGVGYETENVVQEER